VMGRLVHTGLGSSSLVAHVPQYPPPPHAHSFVLGPAVINTHTQLKYKRPTQPSLGCASSNKGASARTGSRFLEGGEGSASTNTFLQAARRDAHSGRKRSRQGEDHEDSPADVALAV
jgi:hypothetical protein